MTVTGLGAMLGVHWRTHRRGTLIWMFALIASLVATAAAVVTVAGSPAPSAGWSGRLMSTTSISGTSENFRIG